MLDCLSEPSATALPLRAVAPAGLEALLAGLPTVQAAFLRASGFAAKAQELRLLPGGNGIAGATARSGSAVAEGSLRQSSIAPSHH
jgi:leucyl aminopeptidase